MTERSMMKHNGDPIKKHLTLTKTPPSWSRGPSIERLNIIFNTGDNFVPNQDEIHFGAIFCVFVLFNKIFLSTQSISWQVDCDWAVGPWFDHRTVLEFLVITHYANKTLRNSMVCD